jgi:hypothetical protein
MGKVRLRKVVWQKEGKTKGRLKGGRGRDGEGGQYQLLAVGLKKDWSMEG